MCMDEKRLKYVEDYLKVGIAMQPTKKHRDEFLNVHKYEIPEKLYYYQPFSQKHHVKSLCEFKLWCSFPSEFNDPNDSKVIIDVDEVMKKIGIINKIKDASLTDVKMMIQEMLENDKKNFKFRFERNQENLDAYSYDKDKATFFGYSCYVLGIQREYLRKQWLYLVRLEELICKSNDKKELISLYKTYLGSIMEEKVESSKRAYAVCSFTTNPNDMLMWTHYADQHRGICLEFSRDSILKTFWMFFPVIYDKPISYSNLLNKNAKRIQNIEDFYLKRYLYKTKNWQYEDEWRAILETKLECKFFFENTKGFLSAEIIPNKVFLGNNMGSDDKRFIRYLLDKKNQDLHTNITTIDMHIRKDTWDFE